MISYPMFLYVKMYFDLFLHTIVLIDRSLDKASHLIPDLISFVPLYVYVQPHLCNWHLFYQQWHVSLTF